MYATSLFVVVPVAIVLVASASRSSASPTMVLNKHHMLHSPNKTKATMTSRNTTTPRRTRTKHNVVEPRSYNALTGILDLSLRQLSSDHDGVLSASNAFSSTAKNTCSQSADDSSKQQACAAGLSDYRDSLYPLKDVLAQLGSSNGLANYDKTDQLQTYLKEIINSSKYTLSGVSELIDQDSFLGPLLGPIVYDIKCILDELLDATENITDGLLNTLAPLLKLVIYSARGTVCKSILPPIAGFCLGL